MTYFWDPPGKKVGLNEDIHRHREEEAKLDAKILLLEGKSDPMSQRALATYRHIRAQLLQSKAEVTSKIGRGG